MEENTKAENNTRMENEGNESEQGQGKSGKTFTQDEVNGIVQSRISQMKKQAAKEQEAEYVQKMQELQAREMKISVRETLIERKMPMELADIITCADANDLKSKLDIIQKIYGSKEAAEKPKSGFRIGTDGTPTTRVGLGKDPVRKAMGIFERDD